MTKDQVINEALKKLRKRFGDYGFYKQGILPDEVEYHFSQTLSQAMDKAVEATRIQPRKWKERGYYSQAVQDQTNKIKEFNDKETT